MSRHLSSQSGKFSTSGKVRSAKRVKDGVNRASLKARPNDIGLHAQPFLKFGAGPTFPIFKRPTYQKISRREEIQVFDRTQQLEESSEAISWSILRDDNAELNLRLDALEKLIADPLVVDYILVQFRTANTPSPWVDILVLAVERLSFVGTNARAEFATLLLNYAKISIESERHGQIVWSALRTFSAFAPYNRVVDLEPFLECSDIKTKQCALQRIKAFFYNAPPTANLMNAEFRALIKSIHELTSIFLMDQVLTDGENATLAKNGLLAAVSIADPEVKLLTSKLLASKRVWLIELFSTEFQAICSRWGTQTPAYLMNIFDTEFRNFT